MNETKLYLISDSESYSMAYAFITKKDRVVVIDGGFPECIPFVKKCIDDREIAAWIFTHPHEDHISGFIEAVKQRDFIEKIEKIYYNFPSADFVLENEPDLPQTIQDFNQIIPFIQDKTEIVEAGKMIEIDELTIEFLFVGGERFVMPKPNLAVNESSVAFKVTAPGMRSVLFLGDLGPEGGRAMLKDCGEKIKADIVQMSHHGHSGVPKAVYRAINPEICMWNAPEWLWNEPPIEFEPELWGTMMARSWMDEIGVTKHYVAKDGTCEIPLK